MTGAVTVAAPAKLNLYLHVTGRRADGYHELDSLVAFLGLGDTVAAAPAPAGEITLAVDGPFVAALAPLGEDNLVLRAARALARAGGGPGARMRLSKRIPLAAGLGGGAADAAAALLALRALWRLDEGMDLSALALTLGADVPACLLARPARVRGVGEAVEPVASLPDCGIALVNPGVGLDTAKVFAAFDALARPPAGGTAPVSGPFADALALGQALAGGRNDLDAAALSLAPAIGEVLAALAAVPGCRLARMSGSGATCFGLFDDRAAAEAARRAIVGARRDWWCWAGGWGSRD